MLNRGFGLLMIIITLAVVAAIFIFMAKDNSYIQKILPSEEGLTAIEEAENLKNISIIVEKWRKKKNVLDVLFMQHIKYLIQLIQLIQSKQSVHIHYFCIIFRFHE